jgi:hypothetical protein
MTFKFYGSLRSRVKIPWESAKQPSISVNELIGKLNIPKSQIKLVMINHSPARPGSTIETGDSVAFFPKEYPFFADWRDFWRQFDE